MRYSAQLLFRAEYLALTGLATQPLCSAPDPRACVRHSDYFGNAFWLLPGDAGSAPRHQNNATAALFAACPLPWDVDDGERVHTDDELYADGDDLVLAVDDGGQWDAQCCGVNLYRLLDRDVMRKNYGYSMLPDQSFGKLLIFAAVFRVLAVLVLIFKDSKRRR